MRDRRPVNLKIVPTRHEGSVCGYFLIHPVHWAQIDLNTEIILLGLSRACRIKAPIMWSVLF